MRTVSTPARSMWADESIIDLSREARSIQRLFGLTDRQAARLDATQLHDLTPCGLVRAVATAMGLDRHEVRS